MIKQRATKHKKGFTLIEVVLVLAIAGLIIVMVMIALPALQRNQRNTQRRRDLLLIASQMEKWRATHNGTSVTDDFSKKSLSNGFCTFYNHYIPDDMVDPSTGKPYKAALWKSERVVDCRSGETIYRGVDETAKGRSSGSYWAKMDVGDIQYDDVAMCDGETFNDELGRSAGIHAFAMRMYLEGGATACIDNGGDTLKIGNSWENSVSAPMNAFGILHY